MMTDGWSWFVIILVTLNILAMVWLLLATSKSKGADEADTTGHTWDGIKEYNNPLPRWWLWLFVITIVFSVVYLYLYPGMGSFKGSLDWTQSSQYEQEVALNRAKQDAYFAEFADLSISELAENDKAMATGRRLFLNNCATCHGSNGQGAKGFPNLRDDDWLYGDSPQTILQTLNNGRAGLMPDLGLPSSSVAILARYVQGLAGQEVTEHVQQKGKSLFAVCTSCHGPEGKGNQALGAPNLTDNIWLYGSTAQEIEVILANGVQGNMPSFNTLLSQNEIKLLAAYVVSLGGG